MPRTPITLLRGETACVMCQTPFVRKVGRQATCSPECSRKRHIQYSNERKRERRKDATFVSASTPAGPRSKRPEFYTEERPRKVTTTVIDCCPKCRSRGTHAYWCQ